ncbi:MAG: DUF3048 domain-containing protein [Clostridia bacterium]|nr:DUF3048 domain-containing protein [Clostridia bacterium]
MKKLLIICMLTALLFTSACGKNETETTAKEEQPAKTEQEAEQSSPFYEKMLANTRPFAVMIDNDDHNSRPQIGLESAYMVYEMVVEGKATRFMALFKDINEMEKIGPIRSSRHYFLDYALENDAVYVHAGWSDRAAAEITSRGVNNINGLYENSTFYRDNTYDNTWHNLYLNPQKCSTLADNKGYRRTTDVKGLSYNKTDKTPEGEKAESLFIPYVDFYEVEYKYNAETKLYDRYINGKPHESQTGNGLTTKNILVYSVEDVPLNDGIYAPRRDLKNLGNGKGYYLSEGVAQPITWEKETHDGKTVYKTQDGADLTVNPGNTFVQLVPTYAEYTLN